MKLAQDWRDAWRWFSIWALSALAALPHVWTQLPYDLRQSLPDEWLPWVASAVAIGGIIGRIVDQNATET